MATPDCSTGTSAPSGTARRGWRERAERSIAVQPAGSAARGRPPTRHRCSRQWGGLGAWTFPRTFTASARSSARCSGRRNRSRCSRSRSASAPSPRPAAPATLPRPTRWQARSRRCRPTRRAPPPRPSPCTSTSSTWQRRHIGSARSRARERARHPAPIGESVAEAVGLLESRGVTPRGDGVAPRGSPRRARADRASHRGQAPDGALEAPARRRRAAPALRPGPPAPRARGGDGRARGRGHRALADRSRPHRRADGDRRGAHGPLLRGRRVLGARCPSSPPTWTPRWTSTIRGSGPRADGSRWRRGSAETATAIPRSVAQVTAETLRLHRGLAIERHRRTLQDLGRRLSVSSRRRPRAAGPRGVARRQPSASLARGLSRRALRQRAAPAGPVAPRRRSRGGVAATT